MQKSVLFLLLMGLSRLSAQQVYYPVESWGNSRAEKSFSNGFRYFLRDMALNQFGQELYQRRSNDSILEVELIAQNQHTSPTFKKPWFNTFYKDGVNFFRVQKDGEYVLLINPLLDVSAGQDDKGVIWQNTRGLEIKGNIGGMEKGVGFYSQLCDNQAVLPYPYRYFTDSLNFVPNEFFYKKFKTGQGVDYFRARAYITFNAVKNHIRFQFGHDRNKIGNGYRSLILSDYAPQYLFFKINTDVGKFHYQNLFTQFSDNGPVMSNVLYGKKYGAFHRLSLDLRPNLNIGINEMILFDRMDSTQMNQFDFNYLNPVIFYRSIESNLGSRDNSLMALDAFWNIRRKWKLYSQFLLDEFNLKYIRSQPNWWANKYGYQFGIKGYNLFRVQELDFFAEYNRVRPYTYSHMRTTQSYTHFNQPLAHPLGANFAELSSGLRYVYRNRIIANLVVTIAKAGRDSFLNGRNYGANPLRSYDTRVTNFDSHMFMGQTINLATLDLQLSYQWKQNIFIDARMNIRRVTGNGDNLFFSLGFRANADLKRFDY